MGKGILIDLMGQRFSRLTVVGREPNSATGRAIWKCICDCGKTDVIVPGGWLRSSNTKSCGCLRTDKKSPERCAEIADAARKYPPSTSSAMIVWRSYRNDYKEFNLTFEQFYEFTQKNCSYCNIVPSRKFNAFLAPSKHASEFGRKNGLFTYNGLDRIDVNKGHILGNLTTCCYICNRMKHNRTVDIFLAHLDRVIINDIATFKIASISLPIDKPILRSIKDVWRDYKDGEMSLADFYSISQMPCFYCGDMRSHKNNAPKSDKKASQKAKNEGDFLYNGADRIDSGKPHTRDNCVPSCGYCNFAKNNLTLREFQDWILQVKTYRDSLDIEQSRDYNEA